MWPLLDFQSAVEDHLQGVTHIIRGKDLMDSTRKQTLLYEHFGWTYPETMYWGRVKVHEWGGFSTLADALGHRRGNLHRLGRPTTPDLGWTEASRHPSKCVEKFLAGTRHHAERHLCTPGHAVFTQHQSDDDEAPRLTFVRHAADFTLEGSYPATLDIPVHPNHASMGHRTWNLADGKSGWKAKTSKKWTFA